jgi:hypothetical protein
LNLRVFHIVLIFQNMYIFDLQCHKFLYLNKRYYYYLFVKLKYVFSFVAAETTAHNNQFVTQLFYNSKNYPAHGAF